MKIAVTYENGTVFQHFGHTEQFKVYQVEDGRHMPVPDLFLSPFPACQGMTGRAIRGTIRINALL